MRINGILTELQKGKYAKGTIEHKMGDFYKLAMDSVRRNKDDVKPLMPVIKEIENAKTIDQLKAIQYKYEPYGGIGEVMNSGYEADAKNAKMNILNIYQGGSSFADTEFFFVDFFASPSPVNFDF